MERKEGFLERWSRLKTESRNAPEKEGPPTAPGAAATDPEAEPKPELPSLDSLGFESDYRAFLDKRVSASVRRAALSRLFHSEHFNRMDGLDVYIDDYGVADPIPPDMLRELNHAREMLFGPQPQEAVPEVGEPQDGEGAIAGDPEFPPASTGDGTQSDVESDKGPGVDPARISAK